MAYPNDWYETLVAAGTAATASLQMPNSLLDAVYKEYSSNYRGAMGQTLTINVPTVSDSNATDIGRGGITGIAPTNSTIQIPIDHKYSSNRKIPNSDLILGAPGLASAYVQPVIEEVLRKLDSGIANDLTAANFPTNGSTTLGADTASAANLSALWVKLRVQGVPMDPSNLFFVSHPVVIGNMMASDDFRKESTTGINTSEAIQREARILRQFKMEVIDDPYMPVTSGAYSALAFHRFAYGLRLVAPDLSVLNVDRVVATVVFPRPKVPVVLETWNEPKEQARYIHAYIMCGHKVVRENLGAFAVTT